MEPAIPIHSSKTWQTTKERIYRQYVVWILLVCYACTFLDRWVFSVSMESIKSELHLSDSQLGMLTGLGFAIVYSIVGLPIARWADRGNRSRIIAFSLGILGATVALCGAITGFVQLLITRMGVAVGEAGTVPPSHALVAAFFQGRERVRAMSTFLLGGPLSLVVGYLMGGWVTEWRGWRAAFVGAGILGWILAGIVAVTIRDPPRLGLSEDGPSEHITARRMSEVMKSVWRQRTFRHLLMAFTIDFLFGFGLVQWLPVFFMRIHGLTPGELGTWMAINWGLGNAIGTFLGRYLARRAGGDLERSQLKAMAIIALVYVPLNAVVLLASNTHTALAVMFCAVLLNALTAAPGYALLQTLVPENMRATAVASVFLVSNLIGLGLGPLAVGVLSDHLSNTYGADGLRYALLACTPGYFWVAAHYYKASRTVTGDLEAIECRRRSAVAASMG